MWRIGVHVVWEALADGDAGVCVTLPSIAASQASMFLSEERTGDQPRF
jgi:hypothetical protein